MRELTVSNRRLVPWLLTLAVVFAAIGGLLTVDKARAWNADYSGTNTLVGYNNNYFYFGYFPYTTSSSVYYVKVWDAGTTYTRVEHVTKQTQTDSNWSSYSNNLVGYTSTTLYSGGGYMANFGYLNGSCLIPQWTFWDCATGSTYMTFLGNGSGYTEGHMGIGNDGWGTYGGNSVGGWFYWQY